MAELLSQIMEWAHDSNGKPIFWLNDMAGKEKSTIAQTVAKLLAEQGRLGASFYFKKGKRQCGNAPRFFSTVARYLMKRVPAITPGIMKVIEQIHPFPIRP